MELKKQIDRLKDNWLLIALIVGILVVMNLGSPIMMRVASPSAYGYDMKESSGWGGYGYGATAPYYNDRDFAPDELERKIVKTVSLSTETKRGDFKTQEQRLKGFVSSSESLMISENVNRYGEKENPYFVGYYTIKVPVDRYQEVLNQLRTLGDIVTFSEHSDDITGSYTNVKIELETEKERLRRYNEMYSEAKDMEDKINLNDRIFDQERKIKYLEDSIDDMDKTIDYSTISLTMSEKQSDYASIALVKFSQLIRSLVESFNGLLSMIFILLPWVMLGALVHLVIRLTHKK